MAAVVTIIVVSVAAYFAWAAIAAALRAAAIFIAAVLSVVAAGAVLVLFVASAPQEHVSWVIGGALMAGVAAAILFRRKRDHHSRHASGSEAIDPVSDPTRAISTAQPNSSRINDKPATAARHGWLDRIGLTRAARERRLSAQLAVISSKAWTDLTEAAPFALNRLSVTRRSCDRFVAAAPSRLCDPDILSHLVVVQKRVPEMIMKRLTLCAASAPAQNRRLIEDLLDQLEQIAAEGERRIAPGDVVQHEALETERAYLQSYLSRSTNGRWSAIK